MRRPISKRLLSISLMLWLVACNAPKEPHRIASELVVADGEPAATLPSSAADAPSSPPPTSNAPVVTTDAPAESGLPEGWQEHSSSEMGVAVSFPDGWEVLPYDQWKLDIREPGGEGWFEVNVIDTSSADQWNVLYEPGMAADALIGVFLAAAQEDGNFTPVRSLTNVEGQTVLVSEGSYPLVQDRVLMGVIASSDRALLMLGHAPLDFEQWESDLLPVYEDMIRSVRLQ